MKRFAASLLVIGAAPIPGPARGILRALAVLLFAVGLACPTPLPAAVAPAAGSITGITLTPSRHQFLADRSGTITFTVALSYKGVLSRLGVRLVAPTATATKWSFVSASTPTAQPRVGDTSVWEFSYADTPASPVTFTVTLNYAAGVATAGDGTVATQAFTAYALQDSAVALGSTGAPIFTTLTLTEAVFHAADSNSDTRIDLPEFLRVLQIYNTRNGTVRTGAYDATFSPAPNTTPVAPAVAHSADLDADGTINLMELMRVMDLSKYATPAGRTGEYRADSRGADGFAPGP